MANNLTPKFGFLKVDENDTYDYSNQQSDNWDKADKALKEDAPNVITSQAAAAVPITLKAAPGQAADLLRVQDSTGATIGGFNRFGIPFRDGRWTAYTPRIKNSGAPGTDFVVGSSPGYMNARYRLLDINTLEVHVIWRVGAGSGLNTTTEGNPRFALPNQPGSSNPWFFAENVASNSPMPLGQAILSHPSPDAGPILGITYSSEVDRQFIRVMFPSRTGMNTQGTSGNTLSANLDELVTSPTAGNRRPLDYYMMQDAVLSFSARLEVSTS
jgi:hypothetical protein